MPPVDRDGLPLGLAARVGDADGDDDAGDDDAGDEDDGDEGDAADGDADGGTTLGVGPAVGPALDPVPQPTVTRASPSNAVAACTARILGCRM